jgi:hypothetical protein
MSWSPAVDRWRVERRPSRSRSLVKASAEAT